MARTTGRRGGPTARTPRAAKRRTPPAAGRARPRAAASAKTRSLGRRIRVRPLRFEDYDQVCALQLKCFPGMKPWRREQFESQLRIFPEGQLCVEDAGRVVASSSSLIVAFGRHADWHDWAEIADAGMIRNHVHDGDTLYGIEIMVDPAYQGYRLSRRLYEARKQLAREKNLRRIIIGGRIPGYGKYAGRMSAREYTDKVIAKQLYDPVLTAQLANGFKLERLIADYLPSDSESRGHATFLEWINLDYRPGAKRHFRPVQMVRIGIVQYEMRPVASFEEMARQCEYFVDVAGDYHADFVVFPELFSTQLLSVISAPRPGIAARKLAEYTPQVVEMFTRLAIKFNVNIVGGTHFVVAHDKLYNVAHLFRRDGSVATQPKIHATPSERRWWGLSAGDRIEVFETDSGKIAILICYDVEFPELARIATEDGAQILFVPFNTDERYAYLRVRYCAQARCIENHVYAAVAGCTGNLPFVDNADVHYAQSSIFTPADIPFSRDAVAAECNPNIETVLLHDVDLELLRRHRYTGTTQNWNDRRTDLYRVRVRGPGGEREI